jgi:hypothetical protein
MHSTPARGDEGKILQPRSCGSWAIRDIEQQAKSHRMTMVIRTDQNKQNSHSHRSTFFLLPFDSSSIVETFTGQMPHAMDGGVFLRAIRTSGCARRIALTPEIIPDLVHQ